MGNCFISNGANTYTYDLANRLTAFNNGTNTTTYVYNGLGDRLQQIANSAATTYAVDIAGGLTQVLSDGTNTYLYGAGRITQQHGSVTEYYLADALGSVRQLANSGGEVVLARAYDPYGNLVENNAYDGVTPPYGYAGEITDASGMVYLRARYYSPAQGRFVSRDVWEGDYNNPLSLNKWAYVYGNPINYTDPSGQYTYNREYAANYAMDWDHQYGIDPKYDFRSTSKNIDLSLECTLFASSVLYEGGVRDNRGNPYLYGNSDYPYIPYWDIKILKEERWNEKYGGITWFNTPKFYDFATKIIGTEVLSYDNPPKYNIESLYDYTKQDDNWEKKLAAKRSMIQKGDLVFYKQNGSDWSHVAVVVGWGDPTALDINLVVEMVTLLLHQG